MTQLVEARNRFDRRTALVGGGGGAKGGASGSVAKEDPDTLRSRSNAKILEILSEGEIEGWANGLKGIYFDGTPLQDQDSGQDNFKNYKIFFLPGTQDQNYIPDFTDAANTQGVSVQLKHNTPWVHHIVGVELDSIQISIRFPRLQKIDKKTGDIHGSSVHLKFELQTNGGGYAVKIDDTVKGKTSSGYLRSYRVALGGAGPWDIRVTRITDDSTSEALSNDTYIETYSEIVEAKLRYPNTALVGLEFDAEHFGSIPVRTFHIKGVKIKVPTNYDPILRTYAGDWDGTFKVAWSNNPAWVWYEMVTNPRFGMGQLIDAANVDKASLYTIGKYCDELVPSGGVGTEPRFTCNVCLQTFADALKVLQDLATVFRGLTYYSIGLIVPVQDGPNNNIDGQFSPENIVDGKFSYQGSSGTARHNLITVAYNDLSQLGALNYVQIDDPDDIALNGQKELKLTAFACWSAGQAWRLAKWTLLTNQIDNDTVSFKTGQDGMHLRPGMIIQTQDPSRSGRTLSGRIKAATVSAITLDKSVTIEAGKSYQLCTFKADGSVEVKNITNGAGAATILNVSVNYATAPDAQTLWILKVSDLVPELWRVLSAVPTALNICEIVALKYNASKFGAADDTSDLEFPPVSVLPNVGAVKPPGDVTIEELAVTTAFGLQRNLRISWAASDDPFLRSYRVTYRYENANWVVLDDSAVADVTLPNAKPGLYEFSVVTINTLGRQSRPTDASYYVDAENPLDQALVSGLELVDQANDTIAVERDFKFNWRINSPARFTEIGDDRNGMGGTAQDPAFQLYEVTIWNGQKLIYREPVGVPHFVFTLDKNKQANGGAALNAFKIEVRMLDVFNNLSNPAILRVSNPNPQPPTEAKVVATPTGAILQWLNSKEADLDFVEVLMSTDPLDPNPAVIGTSADKTTSFIFNNTTGITDDMNFWLRSVDTFGNRSQTVFAGDTVPGQTAGDVTMSPDGGTITGATAITLECVTTPTAVIHYRNDATPPTEADPIYDAASKPVVSASGDFSARAFLSGVGGNTNTKTFTLDAGACAAPVLTPGGGTYATADGTQPVDAASITPGANLRWTNDGTDPSPTVGNLIASNDGTIVMPTGTKTLKVIAFDPSAVKTPSSITNAEYTVMVSGGSTKVETPLMIPVTDSYHVAGLTGGRKMAFCTKTPQASLRSTTDGSQPTSGSGGHGTEVFEYGIALVYKPSGRVRVIAYRNGLDDSNELDRTIAIDNAWPTGWAKLPVPEFLPGDGYSVKWSDLKRKVRFIGGAGDPIEVDSRILQFALATEWAPGNLRYTLDGSNPNGGGGIILNANAGILSVEYIEGDPLPMTITVKAVAHDPTNNYLGSNIATFVMHITA